MAYKISKHDFQSWSMFKRAVKMWWQRRTRGWDDSETWSLDYEIIKFTLPRLKRFRELTFAHPTDLSIEVWLEMIDDMIYYLETFIEDDGFTTGNERYDRGREHFCKYFHHLWW